MGTFLRASGALLLAASLLLAPMPVAAADPPLGGAVTLPDGTVLPAMPEDQLEISVQAEMLDEHGGLAAPVPDRDTLSVRSAGDSVQLTEPLATLETAAVGPAGALPNGLQREVLGFLPYWKLDTTTRASLRLDLVSTIAYFSIGAQSNGTLARGTSTVPTVGWSGWTSSAMTELINAAHARGVRVVPTITMMAWDYDYSAMSTLLNSSTNRARLVKEVATLIRNRGADGVNVDFEPVPSTLRSQFTTFIRELKAGLRAERVGSYVTVDTMAGAGAWSTGYDIGALSASGAADALVVMAYDFSYAASARAGGVAPMESPYIYDATDAMRDYRKLVPSSKMIWGVPYYGRAWNTTSSSLNSTVRSPASSVAFSYYGTDSDGPFGGRVLGQTYGRNWDAVGQVPWVAFRASDGGWRQAYYDDPTSLRAKYQMVLANDVAGVGIWHLGMDTGVSDLWNVLEDRFSKVQIRYAGDNRYATAAKVSAASFKAGVPVAYVATGSQFPDALAAGPIAARGGGPVLLTERSSLPSATAAELARLKPARIVVMGGPTAVSDAVVSALARYTGQPVTRVTGSDRFATAANASASAFPEKVPVAYVSTGANFPDALAGGVAAGRQKGPILLVSKTGVPAATARELSRLKPARIVVLGGTSVVTDAVMSRLGDFTAGSVTRLAGPDRYATAVAISKATTSTDAPRTVYVATGTAFADGIAATPAAIRANGPLLILPSGSLTSTVAAELRRLNPPRVVILGGTNAVSSSLASQIRALWD